MSRSFRPQLEELGSRVVPSANPAISISDVSLAEGHIGQTAFVFTVSLSEASSKEVSAKYATANGSAITADGDFVGKSGTLKFAPGETTKTITVLVNGDAKVESDEQFFVNLSGARNAVIADAQGVGTMRNDDSPPPPPPDDAVAPWDPGQAYGYYDIDGTFYSGW
jgi:large repetitive protein